jgi:hypothetical protein
VEAGLPAGTIWAVTWSGAQGFSGSDSVTFQEPNGTHAFAIAPIAGYVALRFSGTLTVFGADHTEPVVFTR